MASKFERHPRATIACLLLALIAVPEFLGHTAYRWKNGHFLWAQPKTVQFSPYTMEEYPENLPVEAAPYGLATDVNGFVHNGYNRSIAEDSGKQLIFLLGGSTMEGLGASANDQTIAAHLERLLEKKAPGKFRVVNAGYHGRIAFTELGDLQGRILTRFWPRMVIAIDGRNDALGPVTYQGWRPNWNPDFDKVRSAFNRLSEPAPWYGLGGWLMRSSATMKLMAALRYRLATDSQKPGIALPDRRPPTPPETVALGVRAYLANHAAAHAIGEVRGFEFAAVLQPTVLESLRGPLSPAERGHMESFSKRLYKNGLEWKKVEEFYSLAAQIGKQKAWFTDLSGMFRGGPDGVYVDNCHYSDLGNRLIAERLAALVSARLKL